MVKKYFVGIDLGGTRIKLGIVQDEEVRARRIIPAKAAGGLALTLPVLELEINHLISSLPPDSGQLAGIGLAFPGLVDVFTNRILSTNDKYDDAPQLKLADWVSDHWQVPLAIDNDARMAALGEWKYGAGKGTDNLVMMTIGTGIGSSAVIEGKLLRGKHFQAGCLGGHFTIEVNGRKCSCGNEGCLEAYGSTWSLSELTRVNPKFNSSSLASLERIDFSVIFAAAAEGDELAVEIRRHSMDLWSAGIINLIHAYDPELVIIGGGVLKSADVILPYVGEKVRRLAWTPWGQVLIRATELAEDAAILGIVNRLLYNS